MTRHIIITEAKNFGIPEISALFAEKAHMERGAEVIKDILGAERTEEELIEMVSVGDCPIVKSIGARKFVVSSILIKHPVNA